MIYKEKYVNISHMKFAIAKEHRDYFSKNGMVELEGMIKPEAAAKYRALFRNGLAHRLGTSPEKISLRSSEEQFVAGRDLWRDVSELEPLFRQRNFGEIASELFRSRKLRLAFTQYLPAHCDVISPGIKTRTLLDLIEKKPTLKEFSCIQGTIGGLIICLKDGVDTGESLLPKKVGSGVFVHEELPLDLNPLTIPGDGRYLLIAYAQPTSVYTLNHSDSHTHFLKKYDYNFGDKLLDRLHPIVYR